MWDEIINIKANVFKLAKKSEDQYYSIVDDNNDVILAKNVKRWFNNGYILCEEHHEGCNYHKDHETYYDFYYYEILNNKLETIYQFSTENKNYCQHISDFKFGYLCILEPKFGHEYGAIDESGKLIVRFSYSSDEVIKRINILGYYSGLLTEKSERERVTINLFVHDIVTKNTSRIDDFILNLLNTCSTIYEILFHLFLYRDLLKENIPDESVMYFADKLEFFQNGFDIYFILEYLKDKMSISQNLSILYNNARNLNYNYFEREIVNFLPRRVGDDWGWQERLSERKNHLIQLCNKLPLTKYDSDEFNDLLKKYMQKIKSSSPVQAGRKVIIDEYLMLQSNYTKKSIGKRFFCTYLQPASFLDQGKYKDIHVVRDIKNSAIYYLVDGKSIQLCLLDFMCTYEDYLELLK